MHAERFLAAHVLMQLDRVFRRAVHGAHDPPRLVRSDRDHADIERPFSLPNLGKDGTGRPVFGDGVARDAAVSGIAAEPDFAARAGLDRPRSPQRVVSLTCTREKECETCGQETIPADLTLYSRPSASGR